MAGSRLGEGDWHTIVLVTLVNLEVAARAVRSTGAFDGIPRIYDILATDPDRSSSSKRRTIPRTRIFENAPYMLNSTAHWRPLMNGYSGYMPESYRNVAWAFWYFPEDRAINAMREAGVTHVTVHLHRFGNEAAQTLEILSASSGSGAHRQWRPERRASVSTEMTDVTCHVLGTERHPIHRPHTDLETSR